MQHELVIKTFQPSYLGQNLQTFIVLSIYKTSITIAWCTRNIFLGRQEITFIIDKEYISSQTMTFLPQLSIQCSSGQNGQNFSYRYANWNKKPSQSSSAQIPVLSGFFRKIPVEISIMQICLSFIYLFISSCYSFYQYMDPIRNISSKIY